MRRGWYSKSMATVGTAPEALAPARTEASAYLGLTTATLAWAFAFIIGKLILTGMTPLAVAVWRYVFAGLVLAPFVLRDASLRKVRTVVAPLAVMTIAGGVFYPWLFLGALAETSATNTSLLIALNPAFTVLFAPFVGEALGGRKIAGFAVAFAGAVVVITRGDLALLNGLGFARGDLMAVGAAVVWAIYNLASRRVVGILSPTVTNCVVFAISAAALFVVSLPEAPVAQLASASATLLVGIVTMALISSVIAGQLFLSGVRAIGVSRAVVFIYLVPVLTAVLAALALGEELGWAQAAGGCAVLAGVAVTSRS